MQNHGRETGIGAAAGQPLIAIRKVEKTYSTPAGSFPALRNIDLEIGSGEFVA